MKVSTLEIPLFLNISSQRILSTQQSRKHCAVNTWTLTTLIQSLGPYHTDLGLPLVAQMLKDLPGMQAPGFDPCLGQDDSLEKGMATHSSILAWRIPWTEEPGRLQSTGSQRVGHD